MRGRKSKIRVRLLAAYAVMLFLSFALIGIVFNFAARQYIEFSATTQIDTTYESLRQFLEQAESIVESISDDAAEFRGISEWRRYMPSDYSVRQNALNISANIIITDEDYFALENSAVSTVELGILQAVKNSNISTADLRNVLIRTDSGVYYVSAFQAPRTPLTESGLLIIYADIASLLLFSSSINAILIALALVMFVVMVFAAFLLSKTFTRPINKLSDFASKIGSGDFTPSGLSFMDIEFDNLNATLNNAAKQLSIYDSEQKAFFQNASHELRTPLMVIQCHAEGITFEVMEPKKAGETILQETQRLSDLVTDLLYISKIDNITTVYETMKMDLIEIIRSCAKRQQTVAEKSGIRISLDLSDSTVMYECVGELVSRVMDNLVSNAIRYASSEIILSCQKTPRHIIISVTDDGGGIEPESIPHVFERFYKGKNGNHGIGLSIVKSIVEQHHGVITAKNTERSGAAFTIRLPIIKRR